MSFDGASDLKMVLTILAPVLTALVSFLRFDEKASMHHNAAARFASMKRRLHIMISECSTGCVRWTPTVRQPEPLFKV
jgi:hypothetical protein